MTYAKTPLKVITVAYSDLPITDRVGPFGFAVVLGDCVLPGHIIGRYMTEDEADDACVHFGDHYNIRRHPYKQPWRFAPVLTLTQGGLSSPSGGHDG
jgi:hypothetical protein